MKKGSQSGVILGHFGVILRHPEVPSEGYKSLFHCWVILIHPGVILGHPGVILGHPGVILGHPG